MLQECWRDRDGEDQAARLARALGYHPDRRIDYLLVGRPRRAGAGHVVRCSLAGTEAIKGVVPSDHYGVVADLRY